MSEAISSKFGCPRCGNLLTNITDYSVYRCGACYAVLRANKRSTLELEVLSDAHVFGIGGVSERSSVKSEETNTVFDQGMMAKRVTRFSTNNAIASSSSSYASRYENYTQANAVNVGLQRAGETRDWNRRERTSTSYYLEEEEEENSKVHGNYKYRFDHGIRYIVDDRAELLQKLNELRDHVNRTCDIADKSKDKMVLFDNKHTPSATATTPYIVDQYAMDYANSEQLRRRGLHQPYHPPIEHKSLCTHYSGPYMDRNRGNAHADSFESYSSNYMNRRHHAFSSSSSHNSKRKLPVSVNGERWFPHNASEYEASSFDDHRSTSVNELQQRQCSSVLHPFPDESYRSKSPVPRVLTAGHICQPIAGGAPFLTCRNCSGLLILPKKVLIGGESQKKVKCGACSITIVIVVDNTKRLDFSVHAEGNQTSYQTDDEEVPSMRFHRPKMSFSCEDFDNSGSDFQHRGRELESSIKSSTNSSSSSSDKEVNVQTSPAREKESIIATEMAVKEDNPAATPPPPSGSSLQQYFDYSDKFKVLKHMDKSPRQNGLSMGNSISIKDGSATEIDISSNEFSIAGTSLNSGEAASKQIVDKVAEHMENSFKNLKISKNDVIISEEEKVDVTFINGKVIPDFLIKKAEIVAGPISPGHYWYDFRAGFWGVMDGPCLGIIPPFIEEFNYPMPESCSGGKTGVFVNGRELHEKDLKLLSRRGLPTERDRSYILEISGRVLDEDTGHELEKLGKLAPTVERSNHGFGMRVPKPAAA